MLPHMPLAPVSAYTRELPALRVPHLHSFIHYHCVCVQPLHTYLHALLSSGLTAKCGFDTGRQGSGRQARSWSPCEQRSQETVKFWWSKCCQLFVHTELGATAWTVGCSIKFGGQHQLVAYGHKIGEIRRSSSVICGSSV